MIRIFTFSLLLLIIIGCGKDSDVFIQQTNQIYIDQLFKDLIEPSQTSTYYGDNTSVQIITSEGILLVIDPSKVSMESGGQYMGQQTISVDILDESKEVFYHQLSTEVDGNLFNPEVALKFSITDENGNFLKATPDAVKCYIPSQFNDSVNIELYQQQSEVWTEASEISALTIGDFEVQNSEATIWSDFGYTFYASSDVWYTVKADNNQTSTMSQQLCIESSYDYTNTRMFLVNSVNNSAVLVSYSTILDQFCENWSSKIEENKYKLYVVSAFDETQYGLIIQDINDLSQINEISLLIDGEKLDKETMLSLLSE